MNNVLVNPNVPLWNRIPNNLQIGSIVEIRGTVPFGANIFQVNLSIGKDTGRQEANKALHISVRFPNRTVVRNSLISGKWGDEEKNGSFPFSSGKSFMMLILVEQESYKVAIDGQHCFEYRHRLSFSDVSYLFIDGTVKLTEVLYFNNVYPSPMPGMPGMPGTCVPGAENYNQYPSPMPGTCVPTPGDFNPYPTSMPGTCVPVPGDMTPQTIYNPSIPFYHQLGYGLMPGKSIYIQGRPSASVSRFTINLQCGRGPYPAPDIAFHLDVRHFNNTVVRNSRTDGRWGPEETQISTFPFHPAVNFDIHIRVEHDKFTLLLNNQHLADFYHRILPLTRVNTLFIENDVVVSTVQYT